MRQKMMTIMRRRRLILMVWRNKKKKIKIMIIVKRNHCIWSLIRQMKDSQLMFINFFLNKKSRIRVQFYIYLWLQRFWLYKYWKNLGNSFQFYLRLSYVWTHDEVVAPVPERRKISLTKTNTIELFDEDANTESSTVSQKTNSDNPVRVYCHVNVLAFRF